MGLKLKWRIQNRFPDLELVSAQLSGHVETPGFGGKYDEELYKADRSSKFSLRLSNYLEKMPEDGTLVVNLQGETAQVIGWNESVIFSAGQTFQFHSERKSWEEAEKVCKEEGGHLASWVDSYSSDHGWRGRGNRIVGAGKKTSGGGHVNNRQDILDEG